MALRGVKRIREEDVLGAQHFDLTYGNLLAVLQGNEDPGLAEAGFLYDQARSYYSEVIEGLKEREFSRNEVTEEGNKHQTEITEKIYGLFQVIIVYMVTENDHTSDESPNASLLRIIKDAANIETLRVLDDVLEGLWNDIRSGEELVTDVRSYYITVCCNVWYELTHEYQNILSWVRSVFGDEAANDMLTDLRKYGDGLIPADFTISSLNGISVQPLSLVALASQENSE